MSETSNHFICQEPKQERKALFKVSKGMKLNINQSQEKSIFSNLKKGFSFKDTQMN
jgi:hypothetical protein